MNPIDKTLKWAHNLQASCFGSAVGVTIEASVSAGGNKMIFVTTACENLDNYYVLSEDMPTEALYQEWGRLKDDVGKLLAKYGRRINKHGNQLAQLAP